MDKYEYQVCADQINAFIAENRFEEAMEIADRIDWRHVRSVSMLCTVSELYKINKKFEESREILLLAYDRYPNGRTIVYALCELAIRMNDVVAAVEYYKQYMRIAPDDTNSYVLLYKIYEAQDVTKEERIQVLEEFKKRDYREKWAYELANLYHQTGQADKCVAECDELVLWFGEGKYVRKALELKMQYEDLTPEQQRKYEGKTDPKIEEAYGSPIHEGYQSTDPYEQNPYNPGYDPMDPYAQQDPYAGTPYSQDYYQSGQSYQSYRSEQQDPYYGDSIQVRPINTGKYSTMNLQEELAKSMEEFMAGAGNDIQGNYYGKTSDLYESKQDDDDYDYANPYGMDYENSFEKQNDISQRMYENPVHSNGPDPFMDTTEHEIPQIPEVPGKIEPEEDKRFETVLKQEYDGQISLSLPDTDMVERQITGQLNIEDILNGFEEKQKEKEKADIMSQLEGVIPGTAKRSSISTAPAPSAGVLPSGRMLTLEEEYGGNLAKIREEDAELVRRITGEIPSEEINENVEDTEDAGNAENVENVENTEYIESFEPEEIEPTDYSDEDILEYAEEIPEHVNEDIHEITMEYSDAGAIASAGVVAGIVGIGAEAVAETVVEAAETVVETAVEAAETVVETAVEAAETVVETAVEATETVVDAESEAVTEEMPELKIPDAREITYVPREASVENIDNTSNGEAEAVAWNDNEQFDEEDDSIPDYVGEDYGEVEEIEDIDQPDDLEEMIKTSNLPIEDIERLAQAAREARNEIEETTEPKKHVRSYMVMEEAVKSRRDFDEDEEAIFVRFEGIEALKAQIVDTMDTLSMEASHGNVIITGEENSGRKGLALDIVKAIQNRDTIFSGKVAKISGDALNKKNIPITIKKLKKGALIVENAGGLTQESIISITEALSQETEPVLVVLEGTKESMQPIINASPMMESVFNARIDIAPYTNDDLVAYGKGYAKEQEYTIDEMGILELYTRIGDLQSFDHTVSIDEVKDIVDAAIKHVDRKNMSHFMDVLMGKRYDDEDYIILREKDFQIK